ncbi:ThuA domain-containing protein [Blastopirellula marina]|uniref:ThuA-like domain-containing protein n=1 Tax=Blastopirellula marina DSM 3645 TaxID=314230 RepID=A3ZNM0_9BACT|nr:ThuA domain-containing protein [Blastopirellula marina]EAQ81915.1 hypothetical protein DSM3645_17225 [Blastopirellula marina DSM 3645]
MYKRSLALAFVGLIATSLWAAEPTQVLIVVGPSSHPPGSHEVAAGGRLLKYCIEQSGVDDIKADVVYEWPQEETLLDQASTVVFLGDTFPPQRMPETKKILAQLDAMMQRGCGIVCVHYATGLWGEDVTADGDHPLLRWLGGYFANGTCPHHQGIAKVFPQATIKPAIGPHPILRGWKSFTLHDEPYILNYFGGPENRPADNVTPIATSKLPPENPHNEIVAWAVQREDSGRGFAIVMPHFYKNWENDDLRCCILNGIIWSAKETVPDGGVQVKLPELTRFQPAAAELKPRTKQRPVGVK